MELRADGDDAPHPKYFVCNADEMEPGTFKDRLLLEGDPHQLIEGMIISAYAIQADVAYIFLRWEYKLAAQRLAQGDRRGLRPGYLGKNILGSGYSLELHLHVSAGRYMCGEETGAAELSGGQARQSAGQASVSPGQRPVGQAHHRQQRRNAVQRAAHRQSRRRIGSRA